MVRIDLKEKSAAADTDLDAVLAKQKTAFNARPNRLGAIAKPTCKNLAKQSKSMRQNFKKQFPKILVIALTKKPPLLS